MNNDLSKQLRELIKHSEELERAVESLRFVNGVLRKLLSAQKVLLND